MPAVIEQAREQLHVKELHPTFGAEIEGVDFNNVSDEVFAQILAAMSKVQPSPSAYLQFVRKGLTWSSSTAFVSFATPD